MRFYAFCLIFFLVKFSVAQVHNPHTGEILPFTEIGEFQLSDGNFLNYNAQYGLINHMDRINALPFVVIQRDSLNPWLVILNGGPGRSNLRLSFELDSILPRYNVLIPGYRGIDDKVFEGYDQLSSDTIKLFVRNHRPLFGSQNVCQDINLITSSLGIDSVSLLSHSYGTIIAAELANTNSDLVDTIFAFSPVHYKKPYPSPNRLKYIFKDISLKLGIDPEEIINKLGLLANNAKSNMFYMGVISSMYTREDIEIMINDLHNDNLSVNDFVHKGQGFVSKKWLFDFGLKFCVISPLADTSNDIFYKVSKGFKDIIDGYLVNKECQEVNKSLHELPVRIFIPEYDFFFNDFDKNYIDSCGCGHADMWKIAPSFLWK